MSTQIQISPADIIDRYNSAFGYSAMKVIPRIRQEGYMKSRSFLKPDVYDDISSEYAEMSFSSTVDASAVYQFGIDLLEKGTPALPFVKNEPANKRFIAPPPMVAFSRDKHVVVTSVDRSNYDVVENFGNKPYKFTMKGIVVDTYGHQYPTDLVQMLHKMFARNGTYKVESDIFYDLDIDEILFESGFKIDFVEGFVDTVQYQVTGRAIQSQEFLLK